jgi:hypothetical protein
VKLSRTTNYNFGWLLLSRACRSCFPARFFSVAEFEFHPATRHLDLDAVLAFSRSVRRATNKSSVSQAAQFLPFIFRTSEVTMEQLGPLLDAAKRKDQSIIIKGDRSVSYETVAEVTNAALEHGIRSVALAAMPPR